MAHQLVIRGGSLLDGTGAEAHDADIAVDAGRITEVGLVEDTGEQEIDASGCIVTPGWVDVHTHYDGQATWDPLLSPSCWHGVTTAVMGNCGVGFAPVHPGSRDWLIQLMEGVEDIPGTALHEGIRWAWETFPQYLDALEAMPRALDIAAQVPHGALRAYVMGARGADHDELPTPEEISEMGRLAREGIAAGALGFTTSRTVNQKAADGRFTPSLTATRDELIGIATEIGRGGKGVLGAVADFVDVDAEFELLYAMSEVSGLPLSISTMQTDARPEGWRRLLQLMAEKSDNGARIRGQVATRAIGVLLGLTSTINPLVHTQTMKELADLSHGQRLARLRENEVRTAMLAEADAAAPLFDWGRVYQLGDPPDYDPSPDASLAARAQSSGVSAAELAYDLMLGSDGRELLYMPFNNWVDHNLDAVREMLAHPCTVPGLGDAGAHCGLICDASFPTFLLTYWARDRNHDQLPIEYLVKRQTKDTAELVGLNDRGVLRVGYKADINVINLPELQIGRPTAVYDLPANGRRLVQHATGYVATVVSGEVVMRDGEHTGALPGRLVRGARAVSGAE